MKIINLKAENVKKLIAVDITPDKNMVVISGKNGAGKSSLLDSIYYALAGKSVIPEKPIRDGEEKAVIKLDLGEVLVQRIFTDKGTSVKVSTSEGALYQKPQALLDQLLNSICFDPLEFSRMKSKDQYEHLKNILGVGDSVEQIEDLIKKTYDQRREVNSKIKSCEETYKNITDSLPEDLPDSPIDVSKKIEELNKIRDRERQFSEYQAQCGVLATHQATVANEITALENRLATLKTRHDEINTEIQTLNNNPVKKPESSEAEAIEKSINRASAVNQALKSKQDADNYKDQLCELQKGSEEKTQKINELNEKKKQIIASANIPVKGLDLRDGSIYYNDIPFDQLCSAEKLRISTALVMSSNPKLKIVRIQDGALLDKEGMEALEVMAKEHDFQVWIERVDSSDPISIVIEEGKVKEQSS